MVIFGHGDVDYQRRKNPDWRNTGYTEQGKHRAENNKAAFNPPLPESMLAERARKRDEEVKNRLRLCKSLKESSYLTQRSRRLTHQY